MNKYILIIILLTSCESQKDWDENTKAKVIFEKKFQIKSELSSCKKIHFIGSIVERCIGITTNDIICQYVCDSSKCSLSLEQDVIKDKYIGD